MNDRSRARLLLVELILDLVIFALCAAVCVALLVRARSMSRESTELTQAVYLAQTETWRSHGDGADRTVDGYQVQHTRTGGGTSVQTGRVRISRDGRLIYELEVSLP